MVFPHEGLHRLRNQSELADPKRLPHRLLTFASGATHTKTDNIDPQDKGLKTTVNKPQGIHLWHFGTLVNCTYEDTQTWIFSMGFNYFC